MDFLPRRYEARWAAFVQMIYFHLINRDEQKRWLWIFSTALPLPDSVNEIVFVYSWLRLAFSRQCNLSLHDWLDSCLIHATWKCLYSSVYCGFPQRYEENRWGPHADSSSRALVSLRQRIQSAGTKCACVCLCSCYHRGMWDLHLKQLSPQPDPISHCKGALLLSHLCHTGSLRVLELYIMCCHVCVKGKRGEMLRGVWRRGDRREDWNASSYLFKCWAVYIFNDSSTPGERQMEQGFCL